MAAKEKTSWLSAWLAPILFLLAAVAAAGPASALTCGALETRAWEKTSAPLDSRLVESSQLLNLHQQNEIGGYDSALGSPLAAESEVPAASPVGRSGEPIEIEPGTNAPGTINGRDYTGHALDQMQGRGVPPSAVENTVQNGVPSPGNLPGRTAYYDPANNLTVITDSASGRVITVRQGAP